MKTLDNSYALVRRTQLNLVLRNSFRNGELYEIMNRQSFRTMADKLTEKYFHRSGSVIYEEMNELFRVYLCLAPFIQKMKNSYLIDWTTRHALSRLRRYFGGNPSFEYYKKVTNNREHNCELLHSKLRQHGITDSKFLDFVTEKYLCFWGAEGLKGSLGNCIFDPFIFSVKGQGLRISNVVIEVSKKYTDGYLSISKVPLEVLSYNLLVSNEKCRYVTVELNQDTLNNFKLAFETILEKTCSDTYKMGLLTSLNAQFLERSRYAKDAFEQVKALRSWAVKHLKSHSARNKDFGAIASSILKDYVQDNAGYFAYKQSNFFWNKDISDIPEKTYLIYFSPYREES
jgi:hypothetical protein